MQPVTFNENNTKTDHAAFFFFLMCHSKTHFGIKAREQHNVLFLHWNSGFQFILRLIELQQVDRWFQAALLLTRRARQCSLLQEFASLSGNISNINSNIFCPITEERRKEVQLSEGLGDVPGWQLKLDSPITGQPGALCHCNGHHSLCIKSIGASACRSLVCRSDWTVWDQIVPFTPTWIR